MKTAILFIFSLLLYFVSVSYSTIVWAGYAHSEKAVSTNPYSLPPAEEMIGVIGAPEYINETGEEIQLAPGDHTQYVHNIHGHAHAHEYEHDHEHDHGHEHVRDLIGNVCLGSTGFCYTTPFIVGTPCHCISWDLFGRPVIWLYGVIIAD